VFVRGLTFDSPGPLRVLCLGAHSDDIEIGCGGTILELTAARDVEVWWVVFSGNERRAKEAEKGAKLFLAGATRSHVVLRDFRDGFFPFVGGEVKDFVETFASVDPDVIFTHYRHDRHQDHRVISDLTWNTFRNHLVLEYEIPKYDGDLGTPNLFVPVTRANAMTKVKHLRSAFVTQRGRHWFTGETFLGLMRLRGMESRAPEHYAEGFHSRKCVLTMANTTGGVRRRRQGK
jgi:LmbE family N-acetylglucosaminyl deacetylase